MIALRADGIHAFYGKSHILHGVSLEVREGELVALLGRNGAGKSTTLRSLVGLTPAREGVVRIFGHATTHFPPYRIAGLGVGFVSEWALARRLDARRLAALRITGATICRSFSLVSPQGPELPLAAATLLRFLRDRVPPMGGVPASPAAASPAASRKR